MPQQLDKRERLAQPRHDPRKRPPQERIHDFQEVYLDFTPEEAMVEAQRCIECKKPQCELACPLHNHIRDWVHLIAQGEFIEAALLTRETNDMPEICGRVCPQDRLCESKCCLGHKGQPLALGALERFVNDYAFHQGVLPTPTLPQPTGKKIAIVGSGPAGLACAEELVKKGHQVTVFEAMPHPGGLLVYGIPGFKLSRGVVERRLRYLRTIGVHFVCNTRIGQHLTIDALFKRGYHAVFIATGATQPKRPPIEGMDLKNVVDALPFLIRNNVLPADLPPNYGQPDYLKHKRVAVIGGGDTAMDCLRTAVRLSADRVVCIYRRDEANMPGSPREVKTAKEEGVEFMWLTAPVRFIGDASKRVRAVECIRMELGEPDADGRRKPIPVEGSNFTVEVDFVILAFGFDPTLPNGDIETTRDGTAAVDENLMTSRRGVFAGGDVAHGADLVVTAIRDGRQAAEAIDRFLREG